MGGTWVGGGRWGGQTQLVSLILPTAGECAGGEGVRGQIRPCTRCSLPTSSLTLCLSFSYLRSAVEASFDTRKAFGKPYTPPIGGGQLSSFAPFLAAPWGPGLLSDLSSQRGVGPLPPVVPPGLLPRPRRPVPLPEACPRLPSASPTSWVSRVSCGPRAAIRSSQAFPPSPLRAPSLELPSPLLPHLSRGPAFGPLSRPHLLTRHPRTCIRPVPPRPLCGWAKS
jgi:hypothetical protein